VRTASQLDVFNGRRAAGGIWLDVMELEESPFETPLSVASDECTLPAVALPNGTLDCGRDIS
jgi:hypothetical protein